MKWYCVSLRNILVAGCLMFTGACVVQAEDIESQATEMELSVSWQGMGCSGYYIGDVVNGKPQGTGEFVGHIVLDGEEKDEISYSGNWKNGKMHGKGIWINYTKDIVYEGKFSANRLNGTIKEYIFSENELQNPQSYTLINYAKDIPYNVSWEYIEDSVIDYDCFFGGISIEQGIQGTEDLDYTELLYQPEEYGYHKIQLQCTVEESIDRVGDIKLGETDDILYRETKVYDQDGNYYILTHDLAYDEKATNYIPFLKNGDEITVYGYYTGVGNFAEDVVQYPYINAIAVTVVNGETLDVQSIENTYSDFLDYPYLHMGQEIEITGTVRGMIDVDQDARYFLTDSSDYGRAGLNEFICKVSGEAGETDAMFAVDSDLRIRGNLQLVKSYLKENQYVFCPIIEVTEVTKKAAGEE